MYKTYKHVPNLKIKYKLATKQDSNTSSSSLSRRSIKTSGHTATNKHVSRIFEPTTGLTDLHFNANTIVLASRLLVSLSQLLIKNLSPCIFDQ